MCPREHMEKSRLVGKMPLDQIKKILIDGKKFGFQTLKVYITSEPTVHPDFNFIMKFSKQLGYINNRINECFTDTESIRRFEVC